MTSKNITTTQLLSCWK